MAITENSLTSGNSTGTSAATASVTPGNNRLILLAVNSRITTGGGNTPTATGCSLTWVQVDTTLYSSSTDQTRITLLRAMGSPTSGAVTIDFASQSQDVIQWSLTEFAGVDTSGTNGSGAVVQANKATAGGTPVSTTLTSSLKAGSATYGAIGTVSSTVGTTDPNPGSGYTQLDEIIFGGGLHTAKMLTEWMLPGSTTVDGSDSGNPTGMAVIGIEIGAATVTGIFLGNSW